MSDFFKTNFQVLFCEKPSYRTPPVAVSANYQTTENVFRSYLTVIPHKKKGN